MTNPNWVWKRRLQKFQRRLEKMTKEDWDMFEAKRTMFWTMGSAEDREKLFAARRLAADEASKTTDKYGICYSNLFRLVVSERSAAPPRRALVTGVWGYYEPFDGVLANYLSGAVWEVLGWDRLQKLGYESIFIRLFGWTEEDLKINQ